MRQFLEQKYLSEGLFHSDPTFPEVFKQSCDICSFNEMGHRHQLFDEYINVVSMLLAVILYTFIVKKEIVPKIKWSSLICSGDKETTQTEHPLQRVNT